MDRIIKNQDLRLSRREFLRLLSVGVGLTATGGWLVGCTTPTAAPTTAPAATAAPVTAPSATTSPKASGKISICSASNHPPTTHSSPHSRPPCLASTLSCFLWQRRAHCKPASLLKKTRPKVIFSSAETAPFMMSWANKACWKNMFRPQRRSDPRCLQRSQWLLDRLVRGTFAFVHNTTAFQKWAIRNRRPGMICWIPLGRVKSSCPVQLPRAAATSSSLRRCSALEWMKPRLWIS